MRLRHQPTAMRNGRERRWRRRLDAWLRRHQWRLWLALVLLAMVIAVALTAGIGRSAIAFLRDPGAVQRRTISLPPEDLAVLPDPHLQLADEALTPQAPQSFAEPAIPTIDWASEERILRAAILLAANHRPEAAFDLLLARSPRRESWADVARSGYATADASLRQQVEVEWQLLAAGWNALPEPRRLGAFRWDGEAQSKVVNGVLAELPPIDEWAASVGRLPISLQQALLHNLAVKVHQTTGMPAIAVQLLVSARFLPEPLTQGLFNRIPLEETADYGRHEEWLALQLDHHLLPDLAVDALYLLRPQLLDAARDNPRQLAWMQSAWGEPFCRSVRELAVDAPAEVVWKVWQQLPELSRILWSRNLAMTIGERHGHLPVAVIEASQWLRAGLQTPDKVQVLRLVRQHPAWQRQVNAFHYEGVNAALTTVLAQLRAEPYRGMISLALLTALNRERPAFERPDFPWARLAEEAKIADDIPDALEARVTRRLTFNRPIRPTARTWDESDATIVYRSLLSMGARAHAETRAGFEQLALLYGINRGILRDDREAQAIPRELTPDPINPPAPPAK